jgi:hypothetical protein
MPKKIDYVIYFALMAAISIPVVLMLAGPTALVDLVLSVQKML